MQLHKHVFYPLFSTVTLYLAFNWGLPAHKLFLDRLFSLDFVLQLMLGMVLFLVSRKEALFLVVQVVMMSVIYLATPIKRTFFSSYPFGPDDLPGVVALVQVLPLSAQLLIGLVLLTIVVIFFYNLNISRNSILLILGLITLIPLAFVSSASSINAWLNKRYQHQVWNKAHDYSVEGGTVYLAHEMARLVTEIRSLPDEKTVIASTQQLQEIPIMNNGYSNSSHGKANKAAKRSVYLVVVESLIDPVATLNIPVSKDPYYEQFRNLYKAGGSSVSLSPVYTGGTANAEFEILCGLPVFEGKIEFEYQIKNDNIGCLPEMLDKYGYETFAVHPNIKTFWNRDYAYPKIGFKKYYYDKYFNYDEMNGAYLSDASLFRQNLSFIKGEHQPVFNYLLTISNHYPYQADKRLILYRDLSTAVLLDNYLDSVRYSTKQIFSYIESLMEYDPNALLVIVGDHSPYFGPNLQGYNLMRNAVPEVDGLVNLTSTPLLIIDGQNGPKQVGRIAHYEIPRLILNTLGLEVSDHARYVFHSNQIHIRPIAGQPILAWDAAGSHLCYDDVETKECQIAALWRRNVQILRRDLLFGEQHQLHLTRNH